MTSDSLSDPAVLATRDRRGARLPVAAVVATAWAALLSFVPVLALVLLGAAGTAATTLDSLRLASAGWLLAHGVAIQTPADRVSLIPLALTAWVIWRTARAGIHVSRAIGGHRTRSIGPALAAGAAVAGGYGALGAIAATLAKTPDISVPVAPAVLTMAAVGGIPACLGALGHSRAGRARLRRLPATLVDGVRVGLLTVALMLAVGAAGAGISLALHGGDAAAVLGGFHAGVLGQAGITVACVVYAPNAAIWSAAYLIGPGFAVGVGTTISPGAVLLGPVPAVPLLSGLPTEAVTGFGPALLAAPLVAALGAGWLLARRTGAGWSALLASMAIGASLAGLLMALLAWASAGSLGSGRLSQLGPAAAPVGLWAAILAAAGLVIGAIGARAMTRNRAVR